VIDKVDFLVKNIGLRDTPKPICFQINSNVFFAQSFKSWANLLIIMYSENLCGDKKVKSVAKHIDANKPLRICLRTRLLYF
jgi:hypothetical protein